MHSFRTRILLLVVGLVVVTQSVTLFAVLARTSAAVAQRAAERLAFGGRTVDQLVGFRNAQLASAVTVLSADFGFREAVASGDRGTIVSALENQGRRIDAGFVAVFDPDGKVVASTNAEIVAPRGLLRRLLASQDEDHPRPHALRLDERGWQVFVAPVRAPETIAWVAIGFALDARFVGSIRDIAGVDVSLIASRSDQSSMVLASTLAALAPGTGLRDLAMAALGTGAFELGGRRWLTYGQPLDDDPTGLRVVLQEAQDVALRPYYELRNTVLLIGGTALLGAIAIGLRLGRVATRPVDRLMRAARRIEGGEYADIPVVGNDEFARLSSTMNGMQRAIAEREQRLAHAAFHDALTGLPNTALATRHLQGLLRSGAGVAVIVLETRGLRDVSATFGHELADRTVVAIAARLKQYVRRDDLIARIGDERFVAISPDAQVKPALALAAQLCGLFGRGLEVDGLKLPLDAVAGVALATCGDVEASALLSRGEVALQDARESGQSIALYVAGRDARVRRRLEVGARLREALATGAGLRLLYQPKVAVGDGALVGVEALLRWRDATLGDVSPSEFAPLAEQIGVIRDLTRWVMREALRQLAQWRAAGLSFDVAINVSAADVLDIDLGEEVLSLLRRHEVPPNVVVLEVTESALVRDAGAAARNIELLQAIGVRFAIDDFGTGHSSLSLLQRLPFDELKVDRSFLEHAHESADDRKIVASTIDLAHSIGMKVVAEGVELAATMQLLRELGCDVAQGYLVSRPIAADEVPGFCVRAGISIPSGGCSSPPSASNAASC